jgi:hypothetical protein|tara:strand:+ start:302 stop:547 length:246 start_codon:yes stop_codon:yes gene_type:complete
MGNSILDSEFDPIYDQIKGILGEHFINYCFIVMDENGDLYYDYTNMRIAKMLIKETAEEINASYEYEDIEIEWDDEEEEEE